MTIGEAAQKYDLSVDTLRYYERIGLIPPVPRTPSGLRDYDEESCGWVEFVKCMRSAGVAVEALIQYVVDPAKCKGCTRCAQGCPTGAISGAVRAPHIINQSKCIKCGACMDHCRFGAISKQ